MNWKEFKEKLTFPLDISFQDHDRVRKFACIFAGMNHMQPLLLATTNSNYLLDRFCMERCCSSEYVSRIVTSLIFMEILATFIVAPTGIGIANWQGSNTTGQNLNTHNEDEEKIRGIVSSGIQFIIFLGYLQIFLAFTTGGKKGHMHWFYVSLMIQQFVCLLIGGAIGFWEGGVTLWYLMAIPMGPIPVFFYQMIIHSWIRNNGPRDVEYIVVEYQIVLAISISSIATTYWILGYLISYYPIELEITGLTGTNTPGRSDTDRIDDKAIDSANIVALNGTPTGQVSDVNVTASVHLSEYSITLTKIPVKEPGDKRFVTVALTGQTATVTVKKTDGGSVTGTPKTLTEKDVKLAINLGTGPATSETLNVYSAEATVTANNPATLTLKSVKAEGIITSGTIQSVTVTIPVAIIVKPGVGGPAQPVPISSVVLTLPTTTTQNNLQLSPQYRSGILTITVTATSSGETGTATVKEVSGHGFSPKAEGYCFYSVRDSAATKDIWANIGGKCEYAACYYKKNDASGTTYPALLVLYFRTPGGSPERKFFGRETTGSKQWYGISEDEFIKKLPALASTSAGQLDGLGDKVTDQYNRVFEDAILNSPTWLPLLMHGMAVGSFGSIFPNLIPKTLTCARTSRTLTVVSIFLSPLPGIFNVLLADNGWPSAACAWTEWTNENWGWLWQISWSLYILYGLAFLFAIFNVHSPEWKLCCYIRSHGWMPFMMTLSVTLIIEILIAIARAGIMMQRPAPGTGDKNHPLLWNKMFCLMSLSYLPFWLTTTPMMKSYVSSLDPFLCDKDRDHWPTARYGAWRSGWYWCKCGLRGLYNTPRKLVTLNMRKALTRKDPLPVAGMTTMEDYRLYGRILAI